MASSSFVHLHVHSEHSALDSTARVGDLIAAAAADGQPAIAITDHGTLGGIFTAMTAARAAGIKLIAGEEMYLAIGDRHERNTMEVPREGVATDAGLAGQGATKTKRYHHLTVLARNQEGWANLVALHNEAQNSRWGKHPRIDYDLLADHAGGLIVLTGCLGGPVLGPLAHGDEAGARAGLEALIGAVGPENVYVEVMEHGVGIESAALPRLAELADEYGLTLIATNDAHHVEAGGSHAHEAWLALQTKKTLIDPPASRFTFTGSGYHVRTAEEMFSLRDEDWWARACRGTVELAEQVEADVLPEHYLRLPKFPTPDGFASSKDYFVHLVKEGATRLYGDPYPEHVRERLNTEMKVIRSFGVIDYFLIVHELITWARSQGIRVGPGRGSAAGSIASFCLGIVQVDPLRFDLLFERFLDPTRVGMPDIDIDFEKGRRDEVLAHLVDMYGEDYVARIGTFQVSKTKASIKSAARVLGLPATLGDKLSKAVPMDGAEPYTFTRIDQTRTEDSAGFWAEVDADERAAGVVSLARQFEEVTTGASIHACGTVVSDAPLGDLIPMRKDTGAGSHEDDPLVTEWDAAGVDDGIGLLKLDVLGLRNLDIVSAAVRNIAELTGETIDPDHLPDGDDLDNDRVLATWRLLAHGHTAGVFQLDSSGMRELTQDVAPTSLEHLSALVALYRPGPMAANMHTRYAARKNGREGVDYSIFTNDPAEEEQLARVLGSTFALTVYQEQAMLLGDVVAGFGPAERNRLRKGISKKIAAEVDAVGELFLAGAVKDTATDGSPKLAFSARTAERVWDSIKGGASYTFNKSHSAAYGYLAYVTAFLKANWPSAYGAALLAETDDPDKRAIALTALDQEGVQVLPPQVNSSQYASTAVDSATVVLGLGEVRDVGKAARAIVDERASGGVFSSMADVLARVELPGGDGKPSRLTTKAAQGLIECGAADEFGPRKGQMRALWSMRAQGSMRSHAGVPVSGEEWGLVERAVRQHERLGLVIGRHPMSALSAQVKKWDPPVFDEYGAPLGARPRPIHKALSGGRSTVLTVGLVTQWKVKPDNRGGRRAFLTLEGSKGSIEAMVWDSTLKALDRAGHRVGVGSVVGVQARVRTREFEQADEEGNLVTVELHSLTVTKMWPIGYQDVDEVVASPAPAVVDLQAAMFDPNRPPTPTTAPEPATAASTAVSARTASTTGTASLARTGRGSTRMVEPAPVAAPARGATRTRSGILAVRPEPTMQPGTAIQPGTSGDPRVLTVEAGKGLSSATSDRALLSPAPPNIIFAPEPEIFRCFRRYDHAGNVELTVITAPERGWTAAERDAVLKAARDPDVAWVRSGQWEYWIPEPEHAPGLELADSTV
ncbi:DNA polymerase III subunit alpha [Pseudactinotalea sp. HY160]|uniref:DNA polymerase III subunit alpha n=1 Tax=Pseudactinotalea sp. HY160 TaxID=2654490 RepID=UPI00128E17DF|nr:DNA polymerase III subunit alpha [Pseudactinotalea sp. HY160]MPV50061.1 DNA polymerase III subunit alpha [Pseudactinotalea sp. HY160]